MEWEPRPVPTVNPETERFWDAAANEQFLVQECQSCGLVYFYPRSHCPECFSPDVDWLESTGDGVVYSYSVAPNVVGWPEDELPLVVAYVELDEGPRVLSNIIDCDPDDVTVGSRVHVDFVGTSEDGIGIPVFTLE